MQELIDGEVAGGVDFAVIARGQDADTDGDGIKDVVDEDDDNDTIPDAWEAEQGLNPMDKADADQDADEDGATNLAEYQSNTNPNDKTVLPKVDVWVADPSPDQGVEPNTVSSNIWVSPDIWLRNQNDGSLQHQNVKQGQDNFVSVRVKNRGNLTAKNTKVEVYYIKASLGRAWPKDWKLVGTSQVNDLAPAAQKIVVIPWTKENVPGPGHYCFYVRLVNDADPMTFPEGSNAEKNTRNNNNIAWRNFDIVGLTTKVTDKYTVTAQNPNNQPTSINLKFEEPEGLVKNTGAKVLVDLGPLFDRWIDNGAQGENITPVEGTTMVELTDTPAKIIGLPMDADEEVPVTIQVVATEPAPEPGTSHEYHFSIQEEVDGEIIGGVDSTIVTRAQETDTDNDGTPDIADEDDDNDNIPDAWENDSGLNPLDVVDAEEDMDGDGFTNVEEYASDTNPAEPKSHPGTPWAMTVMGGFYESDESVCSFFRDNKARQDEDGNNLSGWSVAQWIPVHAWLETYNPAGEVTGNLKVKLASANADSVKICPAGVMTGACVIPKAASERELTSGDDGKVNFTLMVNWPALSKEATQHAKAVQDQGATPDEKYRVNLTYTLNVEGGKTGQAIIGNVEKNLLWNPAMMMDGGCVLTLTGGRQLR
jgi:hypothetical protein